MLYSVTENEGMPLNGFLLFFSEIIGQALIIQPPSFSPIRFVGLSEVARFNFVEFSEVACLKGIFRTAGCMYVKFPVLCLFNIIPHALRSIVITYIVDP